MFSSREVCVMQNAEAVLDIIRERGSASARNGPLESRVSGN